MSNEFFAFFACGLDRSLLIMHLYGKANSQSLGEVNRATNLVIEVEDM